MEEMVEHCTGVGLPMFGRENIVVGTSLSRSLGRTRTAAYKRRSEQVSRFPLLLYAEALKVSCVGVLQGGCSVEDPSSSQCPAPGRGDDLKEPICDDIRLDDEWKHLRLRQGTSGCKPDQARRFFALGFFLFRFVDNDKILQLEGVTKGLIYIHDQGMIHADLKGVRL